MKKKSTNNYEIDDTIVKDYVEAINSLTIPISRVKEELCKYGETQKNESSIEDEKLESIVTMYKSFNKKSQNNPKSQGSIALETIGKIMEQNNGVMYTRMLEPLNISRQYLSILEKNKKIEKTSRGVYINSNALKDDFYSFQLKYKKAIFSHMTALYFHGITEEIPYDFTVTVPNSYHTASLNERCNVFYVDKEIYELGMCGIKTPNGNTVRAYDVERCICDIIRSKNRLDFEQVKKTIRLYVKSKNKNILKLSKYAKKMNVTNEVMGMVNMYYE